MSARLPRDAGAPVVFSVDAGTGGEPHKRDTVTIDRRGTVVKVERFADVSRGIRWRIFMRFAHTGAVLGVVGQTIAGIASLGACVLAYTGAALSWRRWRNWRQPPRCLTGSPPSSPNRTVSISTGPFQPLT
jgi:uncharacterized iron-regulated membrane protein